MPLLPLLLFMAPVDAPLPEDVHACVVQWSEQHDDEMFIEITEPRILKRCDELLVAMEFEAPPNSIRVELDGEMLAFTAKISILDEDGVATGMLESVGPPCECGPGKTADFVMKNLAQLVKQEQDQGRGELDLASPPELGAKPVIEEPEETPHTLRWVGAGVGVVGLGFGISGGVLMSQTEVEPAAEQDRIGSQRVRKHPFKLTGTLVGCGVVAVAAGVALVVVDEKRSRGNKKTALVPSFGPHYTGLSLTGKF